MTTTYKLADRLLESYKTRIDSIVANPDLPQTGRSDPTIPVYSAPPQPE